MTTSSQFPLAAGVETTGIHRAAVIGAGAMGAGIAAQFANAGIAVDLLDIAGPGDGPRNAPAEAGKARQLAAGGFMHPAAADLVHPGNVEDDLSRLADADWIVEAIIERLDLKRDLYKKLDSVRKPGSIVSSNTSTIPRAELVDGLGETFAADFLITHFFNPPRIMRLVEIVSGPQNAPSTVAKANGAAATVLGKTVVECRDTPGFIANRIGCYWLAVAVIEAENLGLTPEEADAVMSAMGVPKTGAFGLLDLIGIDLVPNIWGSLIATLPKNDDIHRFDLPNNKVIKALLAAGRFGRKAKAGFYRLAADKSRETLDFATNEYRPEQAVKPASLPGGGRELKALFADQGKMGQYAWRVLSRLVAYAAHVGPDVAGDTGAIDVTMQLGYAWKDGPFALVDRYGPAAFADRLASDGQIIPPLLAHAASTGAFFDRSGGGLNTSTDGYAPSRSTSLLTSARRGKAPIFANDGATLWDLGNGVAGFEMKTKLNSFAPAALDALEQALSRGGQDFTALVLGNDDPRAFSAGADLGYITALAKAGDFAGVDAYLKRGQSLFLAMKYSAFPVVAAVHGIALGGGCEFMLHADTVVAHAELTLGLPETKVGLVPGWGGCAQMLLRAQERGKGPADVFAVIQPGTVSTSAADARVLGTLRDTDMIAMNRDQLLTRARDKAAAMAVGYQPPQRAAIALPGTAGKSALMEGRLHAQHAAGSLSDTDMAIADALATVLTGGNADPSKLLSEADILALEMVAISTLARQPASLARIEHMLATGKPLRN